MALRPKAAQQGLDHTVAQQKLDQTIAQQGLDQTVAQQALDQTIAQRSLDHTIGPIMDVLEKSEHEVLLRDFRIKRLREAMEFIRDHSKTDETRLYAMSALEADNMMR
jgi:hypothetical protein